MDTYHQPSTILPRAELMSAGRYQPYRRSRAQRSEYINAEAGPSTLASLAPIPCIGLPRLQPSGGAISESPADAENAQTIIEDKVPVSNFYCSHIPHVIERFFGVKKSPSGLSALRLVAKDLLAPTARGCRRTLSSCSTGHSVGWGSEKLQSTTWL